MTLYHKDIGLPAWFRRPVGFLYPKYGEHAIKEANADRYGPIKLPYCIPWASCEVIEIGVVNKKVVKYVVRAKHDAKRDICIVVRLNSFVVTVWSNLADDKHNTLDRSKYARP